MDKQDKKIHTVSSFDKRLLPRAPSVRTLEKWLNDGGCKALDGCWVEPDGTCEHGTPSWLLALGLI